MAAKLTPANLIDEDPDLLALVPEPRRADAGARFEVAVRELGRGKWNPRDRPPSRGDVTTYLILDGAVGLRTRLGARTHLEVLGPGDPLQPWIDFRAGAAEKDWQVIAPTRMAELGAPFIEAAAVHPEVLTMVMHRYELRARRLNVLATVAGIPRVTDQILVLLWYLAERWGRVTPGGIRLPLPLSHQDLADLVAVRRPSITSALHDLRDEVCREDRIWLLTGERPALLERLA